MILPLMLETTHRAQRRRDGSEDAAGLERQRWSGSAPYALAAVICLAVFAAYSNHFHNAFHFDDSHTIVNNAYVRDLRNIPRFFTDGRTFSSDPANAGWRPLVSTSLALDYRLGNGLDPLWFHVSTFVWFLVLIGLLYLLYSSVLQASAPSPANTYIALLTAGWFGLHPANAETVNYIIQRAEIYSTLGVVAALVTYIRLPRLRKFGVYLLPVVLGTLAKQPTVVFCGILLAYVFLFEEDADPRRLRSAVLKSLPAIVVCGALAALCVVLTPKSAVASIMPAPYYWMTQPYVVMRYVRSLFLPLWLTADTDLAPVRGIGDPAALAGILLCLALAAAGLATARRREHRPIAFGILWFFCALAPTSIVVLSELENDHRMFFPFVGLMLSVAWAAALALRWIVKHGRRYRTAAVRAAAVSAVCLLVACALGTRARNDVWRTEATLWQDVTVKSPRNGRGLMNYGLTLMEAGDARGALDYFRRAAAFTPNYATLEINTGIALGLLDRAGESEDHFRRAVSLDPENPAPYFFYGRWLESRGRGADSDQMLRMAVEKSPAYLDARYLLMQNYLGQGQWAALRQLAEETLGVAPQDAATKRYLARSLEGANEIRVTARTAEAKRTPEAYLDLSLLYYRAGRYEDSIAAAGTALRMRPGYAEAYNNIAAASAAMARWDAAIEAASNALRSKPDFQLARNNLAFARAQKTLAKH